MVIKAVYTNKQLSVATAQLQAMSDDEMHIAYDKIISLPGLDQNAVQLLHNIWLELRSRGSL